MVTPPASDENNNTQPAKNRQWAQKVEGAFSCYDEYPRPYAGEYYWRVRAIDANGNTIGTYSDVEKFTVKEKNSRIFAAAFGDGKASGRPTGGLFYTGQAFPMRMVAPSSVIMRYSCRACSLCFTACIIVSILPIHLYTVEQCPISMRVTDFQFRLW